MKLATLNYIHGILQDTADAKSRALEMVRDTFHKAEEEEAPNLETLRELYTTARQSEWDALEALEDFENQEW